MKLGQTFSKLKYKFQNPNKKHNTVHLRISSNLFVSKPARQVLTNTLL